MKAPLVSVVTVTLNNCNGLRNTLESVFSQTYKELEHIVVDGDSKDQTCDLLKKFDNGKLKYISEPDQGIYDAMNKGVSLTSEESKYVIFMNSGDIFYNSQVVSDAMQLAKSDNCHIYGDVISEGKLISSVKNINYYKLSTNMVCHQAILFLKKSLTNTKYDTEYRICSDYKLLLDLIKKGDCFEYIGFPIAIFDKSGISSSNRDLLKEEKNIRKQFLLLQIWRFLKKLIPSAKMRTRSDKDQF